MSFRPWRSGWAWGVALTLVVVVGIPVLFATDPEATWQANTWQRMSSPGPLSAAHATLENSCAACHTAVKGVDAAKCILCHANDQSLLQRQPTAFHANIGDCRSCHREHRGRTSRPTEMSHDALARIGILQLTGDGDDDAETRQIAERLSALMRDKSLVSHSIEFNHRLGADEAVLNCATCHSNDDRHFNLFGNNCAACHSTMRWTIPEFRHPSASSMDCAQCHQAPPSHYMMHFKMISQTVAARPHARVDQCYLCHQTTSWPDIRSVGWYKHH